ncbi:MAG: hypothetical protein JST30_10320 [Armatimonadetes bacterium]|nr:hypothetical protein [Armatimonadota bacterium]
MKHAAICSVTVTLFLSVSAQSQQKYDEAAAKALVASYVKSLDLPYKSDDLQMRSVQRVKGDPPLWSAMPADSSFIMAINSESGDLVGFSDVTAGEKLKVRLAGELRVIKSDADAWKRARQLLAASGLDDIDWQEQSIRKIADEPGAAKDRLNKADRWQCMFIETVVGYAGFANSASVTLDVVSGNVLSSNASTLWRFVPPLKLMTSEQAAEKFRATFEACRQYYSSRGDSTRADQYSWPGDNNVKDSIRFEVRPGGTEAMLSTHGVDVAQRHEARVAAILSTDLGEYGIDAETGEPLLEYITTGTKQNSETQQSRIAAASTTGVGDNGFPWEVLGGAGLIALLVVPFIFIYPMGRSKVPDVKDGQGNTTT